ncbi:Molybdate-binding periplasmic protein precursor [Pseudoruegeria aquimaris]|uniref:Molybdate-binding periplasmic protein n=1 Tax=Pseudoruegeria aquimaris TaxID=393663 RepID=A0A1Y5TEC4_9RHOB|nr:Molybdate-binding periplasmic protein precursor [Pseudoruegeria aquimaris]
MALSVLAIALAMAGSGAAEPIRVFAAASLRDVLDEAAHRWAARAGTEVVPVYAGSGTLARQIAAGAPADLFISANTAWSDWVLGKLNKPAPVRSIAGNRLVIVVLAPGGNTGEESITPALFGPRIAMGLVEAVPAGIYGKQALEALGLWQELAPRVVQADNVRGALAFVAAGAASSGIVYQSDAAAESRVAVAARFPETSHERIVYPAVLLEPDRAGPFLEFLSSSEGQALFASFGFLPVQAGSG